MRYAILGATGTVGRAVGAELAGAGERFRAVGRDAGRLGRDFAAHGDLAEPRVADLADEGATAGVLAGVETVFYLAGVPYWQFERHPKLTRSALAAAAAAGVRHFVHLSTVYPYGRPTTATVAESHPRDPHTFKGRMRKAQEDLVLAADGQRGMRTAVVRPPDFYGPDAEQGYVRSVFDAAVGGGRANVIGPVDTPHEFVFVPDLARALVGLAAAPAAYGRAWNVAGAGAITTRHFAERVFAAAGAGRPRLRVAGGLTLRALGLFNPFLREVVEMRYLWQTPVLLDDAALRRLLPGLRTTSYEDGIRLTLDAMRRARAGAAAAPPA